MRSREPAIGLDLRLARAPRADSAAEALEVGPEPAHPREVVLELGELDLQLALGRVRVVGEDVEDDRGSVDHRHAERLLEVAPWRGSSSSSQATRFASLSEIARSTSTSLPRPK